MTPEYANRCGACFVDLCDLAGLSPDALRHDAERGPDGDNEERHLLLGGLWQEERRSSASESNEDGSSAHGPLREHGRASRTRSRFEGHGKECIMLAVLDVEIRSSIEKASEVWRTVFPDDVIRLRANATQRRHPKSGVAIIIRRTDADH